MKGNYNPSRIDEALKIIRHSLLRSIDEVEKTNKNLQDELSILTNLLEQVESDDKSLLTNIFDMFKSSITGMNYGKEAFEKYLPDLDKMITKYTIRNPDDRILKGPFYHGTNPSAAIEIIKSGQLINQGELYINEFQDRVYYSREPLVAFCYINSMYLDLIVSKFGYIIVKNEIEDAVLDDWIASQLFSSDIGNTDLQRRLRDEVINRYGNENWNKIMSHKHKDIEPFMIWLYKQENSDLLKQLNDVSINITGRSPQIIDEVWKIDINCFDGQVLTDTRFMDHSGMYVHMKTFRDIFSKQAIKIYDKTWSNEKNRKAIQEIVKDHIDYENLKEVYPGIFYLANRVKACGVVIDENIIKVGVISPGNPTLLRHGNWIENSKIPKNKIYVEYGNTFEDFTNNLKKECLHTQEVLRSKKNPKSCEVHFLGLAVENNAYKCLICGTKIPKCKYCGLAIEVPSEHESCAKENPNLQVRNKILSDDNLHTFLEERDGLKIYLVDGAFIRNNVTADFSMGAHDLINKFIPENEVWIEQYITVPKDREAIIQHELFERRVMKKGVTYEEAHAQATQWEQEWRHLNPEGLPEGAPVIYDPSVLFEMHPDFEEAFKKASKGKKVIWKNNIKNDEWTKDRNVYYYGVIANYLGDMMTDCYMAYTPDYTPIRRFFRFSEGIFIDFTPSNLAQASYEHGLKIYDYPYSKGDPTLLRYLPIDLDIGGVVAPEIIPTVLPAIREILLMNYDREPIISISPHGYNIRLPLQDKMKMNVAQEVIAKLADHLNKLELGVQFTTKISGKGFSKVERQKMITVDPSVTHPNSLFAIPYSLSILDDGRLMSRIVLQPEELRLERNVVIDRAVRFATDETFRNERLQTMGIITFSHKNPTKREVVNDIYDSSFEVSFKNMKKEDTLVHAYVTDPRTKQKYWMAWIELEDVVHTSKGGQHDIKQFYKIFRPAFVKKYPYLVAISHRDGNVGPWKNPNTTMGPEDIGELSDEDKEKVKVLDDKISRLTFAIEASENDEDIIWFLYAGGKTVDENIEKGYVDAFDSQDEALDFAMNYIMNESEDVLNRLQGEIVQIQGWIDDVLLDQIIYKVYDRNLQFVWCDESFDAKPNPSNQFECSKCGIQVVTEGSEPLDWQFTRRFPQKEEKWYCDRCIKASKVWFPYVASKIGTSPIRKSEALQPKKIDLPKQVKIAKKILLSIPDECKNNFDLQFHYINRIFNNLTSKPGLLDMFFQNITPYELDLWKKLENVHLKEVDDKELLDLLERAKNEYNMTKKYELISILGGKVTRLEAWNYYLPVLPLPQDLRDTKYRLMVPKDDKILGRPIYMKSQKQFFKEKISRKEREIKKQQKREQKIAERLAKKKGKSVPTPIPARQRFYPPDKERIVFIEGKERVAWITPMREKEYIKMGFTKEQILDDIYHPELTIRPEILRQANLEIKEQITPKEEIMLSSNLEISEQVKPKEELTITFIDKEEPKCISCKVRDIVIKKDKLCKKCYGHKHYMSRQKEYQQRALDNYHKKSKQSPEDDQLLCPRCKQPGVVYGNIALCPKCDTGEEWSITNKNPTNPENPDMDDFKTYLNDRIKPLTSVMIDSSAKTIEICPPIRQSFEFSLVICNELMKQYPSFGYMSEKMDSLMRRFEDSAHEREVKQHWKNVGPKSYKAWIEVTTNKTQEFKDIQLQLSISKVPVYIKAGISEMIDLMIDILDWSKTTAGLVGYDYIYRKMVKTKEFIWKEVKPNIPMMINPVNKDILTRLKPRGWQEDTVRRLEFKKKILVKAPPGAGKSLVAKMAVERFGAQDDHLVIVHTHTLGEQWRVKYDMKSMTVQAAVNKDLGKIKLLVLDEVHHYESDVWRAIHNIQAEYVIGLTATPGTAPRRFKEMVTVDWKEVDLPEMDFIYHKFDLTDIERAEYLKLSQKIAYFFHKSISDPDPKWSSILLLTSMKRRRLVHMSIPRLVSILEEYPKIKGKHNLIVTETVGQAGIVATGIDVPAYHYMRKDEGALERFTSGQADAIVSVRMLKEGFDYPDIDTVIICSSAITETHVVQLLGRGLRFVPGKKVSFHVFIATGTTDENLIGFCEAILGAKPGQDVLGYKYRLGADYGIEKDGHIYVTSHSGIRQDYLPSGTDVEKNLLQFMPNGGKFKIYEDQVMYQDIEGKVHDAGHLGHLEIKDSKNPKKKRYVYFSMF